MGEFQPVRKTLTPISTRSTTTSLSTQLSSTFNPTEGRWWTRRFHLGDFYLKLPPKTTPLHTVLSTLSNSIVQTISFRPGSGSSPQQQIAIASGPRVGLLKPNANQIDRYVSAPSVVYCCAYRHDGRLLALGGQTGLLKIVDVGTKAVLRTFGSGGGLRDDGDKNHAVRSVIWLRDGKRLASCGDDGSINVWDLTRDIGRRKQVPCILLKGHGDSVRDCCLVSKQRGEWKCLAVSGSYDHTVRVWDLSDDDDGGKEDEGRCLVVMDHGAPVEAVLCVNDDDDDDRLLIVSAGGTVLKLWDALKGTLLKQNALHSKTISSLCYVSRRQLRADDKGEDTWDIGRGRVISGGIDGLIRMYDVDTLKCVHGIKYKSPISCLNMSPDGLIFAVGTSDGMVSIRRRTRNKEEDEHAKRKRSRRDMLTTAKSQDVTPDPDDYQVVAEKRKRLKRYDVALRQFRYGDALDEALDTNQPQTIAAVLEELSKRRGLKIALSNRDEITLKPLFEFTVRYVRVPKYSPLLIGVANYLCDLYGGVIGKSLIVDKLFERMKQNVKSEVEFQKELLRLMGQIDAVMNKVED